MNIYQRGERNGKAVWQLRWDVRDPATHKRRYVYETYYGNKTDAKKRWVERAAQIRSTPGYRKPSSAPVREYLAGWLRQIEDEVKPTTLRGYSDVCRLYIVPYLGARPIGELTPWELRDWLAELRQKHSGRTVTMTRGILRRALDRAIEDGLLQQNPVDRTRAPRTKDGGGKRRRVAAFTREQAKSIIEAAYHHSKLGALFEFLWLSGLRPGEALGLMWDCVDLADGIVYIRRSLVKVGGQMILQDDVKTASGIRDLALPQRAAELLRIQWQNKMGDTPFVFPARGGGYLRIDNVDRAFRAVRRAAGVPEYPLYALRHTNVSMQLAAGVSLNDVSKRAGHKNISVTADIYSHLLPEANRAAADRLDEWLKDD